MKPCCFRVHISNRTLTGNVSWIKFKPVQRYLALAQRERFSKVLKHQVNRFRTICTVCGFVALS
ncbi:hypothetical protein CWI53_01620 [Neisseria meningitidis]|nr:hypothetical protein CWI53_01620 [Neisseria meningitidis]